MDYSSTAPLSSHSGIVSWGKEANWFSSCLATAQSDSWVCLNTMMYIPTALYTWGTFMLRSKPTIAVIFPSMRAVTDQKRSNLSLWALRLFRKCDSSGCRCNHHRIWHKCAAVSTRSGRAVRSVDTSGRIITDFTADLNLKVKDTSTDTHCCYLSLSYSQDEIYCKLLCDQQVLSPNSPYTVVNAVYIKQGHLLSW